MTLIVLTLLGAAWLGYFALCFRDRKAARSPSGGNIVSISATGSTSAGGVRRSFALPAGLADAVKSPGVMLEPPRTRQQARRRRRRVTVVLVAVAVVSLLVAPVAGSGALIVHVCADVALLLFALGSTRRMQVPAVALAEVRVLYPDRPAVADVQAVPLGRAVGS